MLVGAQQKTLIPKTLKEACKPSYPYQLVSRQSEHDELDHVIEYIRKLRGVAKVNLLGWSGGGYRTGTYTSQRPEKVEKLVIYASSNYSRKNLQWTAGDVAGSPVFRSRFKAASWGRSSAGFPSPSAPIRSSPAWRNAFGN